MHQANSSKYLIPAEAKSRIILSEPATCKVTGFSRSTVRRKVKDGTFPAPVHLSDGRIGFFDDEVAAWQDRLPRRESDPYDAAYANPAALQRAGVRFAIVSDDASQSRNLPYEAAMARAYGLGADAALRAITLSPAEIFGVAERMGAISPGRDADLFVASGDIMDPRTEVTHVLIDGREQPLQTRHTHLYEQFKNRP